MKPRLSYRSEAGLTVFEVGVVVATVLILLALFLPVFGRPRYRNSKINCTNHLKQIGLAYVIWEGDNRNLYPMGVSVTNGGSMEMVITGNVAQTFAAMSNELSTTKILICPNDTNRVSAASFWTLANSNVSYFVGVDVTNDTNPLSVLSGDGALEIAGKTVKPGLISVWTNDPVKWSSIRHGHSGNIGLADGSVQSTTDTGLRDRIVETGIATNRWAIP